jgi:hypothetical protein
VAGCCEYGDEPAGSGATELVINATRNLVKLSANCAVFDRLSYHSSFLCRLCQHKSKEHLIICTFCSHQGLYFQLVTTLKQYISSNYIFGQ